MSNTKTNTTNTVNKFQKYQVGDDVLITKLNKEGKILRVFEDTREYKISFKENNENIIATFSYNDIQLSQKPSEKIIVDDIDITSLIEAQIRLQSLKNIDKNDEFGSGTNVKVLNTNDEHLKPYINCIGVTDNTIRYSHVKKTKVIFRNGSSAYFKNDFLEKVEDEVNETNINNNTENTNESGK